MAKVQPKGNPAHGRLDVLLSRVMRRVISRSGNPVAMALMEEYGDEADAVIEHYLAPRDRRGRIRRMPQVREGSNS